MSYAVILTGSKQYQVQPGQELLVEKLTAAPDQTIEFDQVLLLVTDKGIKIGTPVIIGAEVTAQVIGQEKGNKIRAATYKAKSRYRKVKGHRQNLTRVKILSMVESKREKEKGVKHVKNKAGR